MSVAGWWALSIVMLGIMFFIVVQLMTETINDLKEDNEALRAQLRDSRNQYGDH